jgi:hypothetical protein
MLTGGRGTRSNAGGAPAHAKQAGRREHEIGFVGADRGSIAGQDQIGRPGECARRRQQPGGQAGPG